MSDHENRAAKKPRIGIVGCGTWGKKRVGEFAAHGAEVVALCDLSEADAQLAAATNGLNPAVFSGESGAVNMLANLSSGLDAIALLTPPQARGELLGPVFEKGLSVYLEKPLCASATQAMVVDAAYENCGFSYDSGSLPITGTGHAGRSPALKFIRDALSSGEHGNLKALHFNHSWRWNYFNAQAWRGQPALGGGHILEKLIHQLEGLNWALGGFQSVSAAGARLKRNPHVWNRISAVLEPCNPRIDGEILLSASFGSVAADAYSIDAVFEEGRFLLYLAGGRFHVVADAQDDHLPREIGDNHYWYPSRQIATFLGSLSEPSTPRSTYRDAHAAFMLAWALRQALEQEGSSVPV